MTSKVLNMLREGRINQKHYDLFMLFEGNDLGRRMLKELIMDCFMCEPQTIGTGEAFAYQEGRRSVWREIKKVVDEIHKEMEKPHDRRSDWDRRNAP